MARLGRPWREPQGVVVHIELEGAETICRRYCWRMVAVGVLLILPAFVFKIQTTPYLYSIGFTQIYLGSGLILSARSFRVGT